MVRIGRCQRLDPGSIPGRRTPVLVAKLDTAPVYGTGDSRFESVRGLSFWMGGGGISYGSGSGDSPTPPFFLLQTTFSNSPHRLQLPCEAAWQNSYIIPLIQPSSPLISIHTFSPQTTPPLYNPQFHLLTRNLFHPN